MDAKAHPARGPLTLVLVAVIAGVALLWGLKLVLRDTTGCDGCVVPPASPFYLVVLVALSAVVLAGAWLARPLIASSSTGRKTVVAVTLFFLIASAVAAYWVLLIHLSAGWPGIPRGLPLSRLDCLPTLQAFFSRDSSGGDVYCEGVARGRVIDAGVLAGLSLLFFAGLSALSRVRQSAERAELHV